MATAKEKRKSTASSLSSPIAKRSKQAPDNETPEKENEKTKDHQLYTCKPLTDEFLIQLTTAYITEWHGIKDMEDVKNSIPELAKSARKSMEQWIQYWNKEYTRENLQKWYRIYCSDGKETPHEDAKNPDEEDEKEQQREQEIEDYMDDFGSDLYEIPFFKHYPLFKNLVHWASKFIKPRHWSECQNDDDGGTDWSSDEENCIFAWKLIAYSFEL